MRDALLDCAVDHFGRYGFEGAATRAIAADCGTAMSSITYHFGGKKGLYLAAADHIAAQINEHQRGALETALDPSVATPAEAIERLVAALERFADIMLSSASARWARFIIREQQEPTEAFDRIYSGAMRPLVEALTSLIAIARSDLPENALRACCFLLIGQVLALRAGRASLSRILGLSQPNAAAQALIRAQIAAHTRAILSAGPETAR